MPHGPKEKSTLDSNGDSEDFSKSQQSSQSSEREGNCYCGKDRNLNIAELLCASCSRWFHESCIGYQLGKLVPFMTNYVFICKNCSPTGLESFKKNQPQFGQMCITSIANLIQTSIKEGKPKTTFSKDLEIIPFVGQHWESLTTIARRATQTWHSTIQKTLVKETGLLFSCEEGSGRHYPKYGLLSIELTQIKPNYEAMIKGGHLGVQHTSTGRGRGTKRKVVGLEPSAVGRRAKSDASTSKSHGYPLEHPYNKDGYRYILAEPDPHAPFRQEFDESSDWAGKPIPGWLYRVLNPGAVLLALHDRAPQLKVSEDRMAVTGEKGYCMVRATHAVSSGTWYWEATIEEMPEGSAVRLGWSQQFANLQAPLGYDKFGYSWRSRKGTRFTEARGFHYSDTGFSEGDTLGFLLVLPKMEDIDYVPSTFKDRPLVKFKSHLYYEEKENAHEALSQLRPLPGSRLIFFKNGVSQGVAFEDIYCGDYYPSISLYKSGVVSVNFGPNFKYPPAQFQYKPMHEKAEEGIIEQTAADLLYLTENDGKLRLDTFYL